MWIILKNALNMGGAGWNLPVSSVVGTEGMGKKCGKVIHRPGIIYVKV